MNYLSGNTNSPIPIPKGYPNNIVQGKGPFVFNDKGEKFIDMWMGYGALLFGHADQEIIDTIKSSINNGWFFSYQTSIEKEFAKILHGIIPSAERVRFATTGSDAVAYAIRAARAQTSRSKILSVLGGYHGVHENMITSQGSSNSSPPDLIQFNNIDQAQKALETKKYACMLLEPILANSGCTPPLEGYLQRLREICNKTGTILIFDEIVTGFRVSLGGAQKKYKVTPDVSVFSKAIACGLPLSVICGKKAIMENFIPTGEVFFAGTFNGNPLSLSIACCVVNKLKDGSVHDRIYALGDRLRLFISEQISRYELDACIQGVGSMFTLAFGCKKFENGIINEDCNSKLYNMFINKMAEKNVLFPPLPTETVFLSPAHEKVVDQIEKALKSTLAELKGL